MAVEAVVQPWNKRAHDEQGYAAVVQLGEQLADHLRVTVQGVVCEREAEADDSADEEHSEDHFLLHLYLYGWSREEVDRDADEGHAAEQVRPDVASFGMDAENGGEARAERRQGRPVAFVQVVVVLQPARQVSEVAHVPRGLPHLAHELLGLLRGVVGQRAQVNFVGQHARFQHLRHFRVE